MRLFVHDRGCDRIHNQILKYWLPRCDELGRVSLKHPRNPTHDIELGRVSLKRPRNALHDIADEFRNWDQYVVRQLYCHSLEDEFERVVEACERAAVNGPYTRLMNGKDVYFVCVRPDELRATLLDFQRRMKTALDDESLESGAD